MRGAWVLAFSLALSAAAAQEGGRTPRPVVERAQQGSQCVADPAFMRRNHMDLLKHQRDDTVRAGARNGQYSLKACIQCHASKETQSVAARESNFCVSCHTYAAVKIDCFECHAAKPPAQGVAFHPLVPAGPGASGALRLAAQVRGAAREGAAR